ncbi:CRISPR-associated endoribonuclease Cas6 [Anaerostipes sp.]|uniref:CRISPR-associated endoribonuclease Cas6 n=1 Tax=Anaerostipes sp. TaxID=1872530 RepID=UPI0025BB23EB|nr:CRISPR-associated endoribonuclease Cas6 [Anaerostipes sp.]MBS7006810.1 CRISPR-associated endoribonuclease Cas6 [Anaerostipes sp.]
MKYKLTFPLKTDICLPINYQTIVQAALLNWINDRDYQRFLHDCGFKDHKRTYKMETHSRIFGKFYMDQQNKNIIFKDEIHLYLSSYDPKYMKYILNNILSGKTLRLGNYSLELSSIDMIEERYTSPCLVKTLSPIVMYSTFELKNGAQKRYYYSPKEAEYSDLIKNNLLHKYKAFHGTEPKDDDFSIQLIKNGREKVLIYKNNVIKGWDGIFKLSGSQELIKAALEAGLGGRNALGFGAVLRIN